MPIITSELMHQVQHSQRFLEKRRPNELKQSTSWSTPTQPTRGICLITSRTQQIRLKGYLPKGITITMLAFTA